MILAIILYLIGLTCIAATLPPLSRHGARTPPIEVRHPEIMAALR
jgi:hypothetical protein